MFAPTIAKEISIKSGIEELGIFEKHNDAWVSSRDIAKLFGKEHKHVMKSIREQILPYVSEEFSRSNFGPSKYTDSRGKRQPEYNLNRKSFTIVAMGFTGKKAMQFKEAYIEAFEAMANVIETRLLSKAGYKEMTAAIAKVYHADGRLFAAEANMINEIILGMKAKDFRAVNLIDNTGHTRDAIAQEKLEQLDKAQRLNAQLITAGMSFDQRKSIILKNYRRTL